MFILHVTVSTRVTVPVSPRLPLLARTTTPVGCAAVPEGMAQQTNVYSKQSTIYPAVIAGSSAAARTPAAAVYCPTYIEKLDALAAAGPVAGTTLTNMTRKQQTEPKPCLSRLLSHLRDPAELRKLLGERFTRCAAAHVHKCSHLEHRQWWGVSVVKKFAS